MKVYIVYEIYGDYNDYQNWIDYGSRIDSVYIDKDKALKRATEIFNEERRAWLEDDDDWFGCGGSAKETWAEYGPESPDDIIAEYDAN